MTQADVIGQLQRGVTTAFAIAMALDQTTVRVERKLAALHRKGMVERTGMGGYRLVEKRRAA